MKDGAYVINFDEYKSVGTQWVALHVICNNGMAPHRSIYFDRFGVEHIPKEIGKLKGNKTSITKSYSFEPVIQ